MTYSLGAASHTAPAEGGAHPARAGTGVLQHADVPPQGVPQPSPLVPAVDRADEGGRPVVEARGISPCASESLPRDVPGVMAALRLIAARGCVCGGSACHQLRSLPRIDWCGPCIARNALDPREGER